MLITPSVGEALPAEYDSKMCTGDVRRGVLHAVAIAFSRDVDTFRTVNESVTNTY